MKNFLDAIGSFSMMGDSMHAESDAVPAMEALLTPRNGPSQADNAILESNDEVPMDSGGSSEEDDIEVDMDDEEEDEDAHE
jgi:hypothetical protein